MGQAREWRKIVKLNSSILNDNEMSQKSKQMQQKEIDKANYGARAERTEAAEKVNKSQSSMNSECRYLVKTKSAT